MPQQVEQRAFHGRHRVDRRAQVERLQAPARRIAVGKGEPHGLQHTLAIPNRLSHNKRTRVVDRLADRLATGHFAEADIAGTVSQDQHVAREPGPVGTTEVEQHAVAARDGDNPHRGHDGKR